MLQKTQNKIIKFVKKNLVKKNSETFTAVNLGNYFTKGIVVKKGQIVDYFIETTKDFSEIIEKLKVDRKTFPKKIRASLKSPACLVRYFPFPKTDRKKLKQALYYQLNKFIPYPPKEVYFDYTVLKEIDSSQNYILLAVAKKDYIDSILDSFKKKGILISEITLDSISLINLFLDRYPESKNLNCCILDIGHGFSTMNILEKGVPFFSREAKFSAKDIVEIITRIKNLSQKEAGKVLFGLEKKDSLFALLEENISDWCKEIKNSFDFFELNKGKNLDKLYLTGGLAAIPGIADIFSENLEMDTEILQPDKAGSLNFSDDFPRKEYQGYKHNLAVSSGLAL
ncbi:MAG: pilus assembly protein PilM [Candidatus Omnitrophica bacterium]|nr:pilus assembly protein PilM [Candidatus Omnitrophota bacterium]MCF7877408.1 pilus assembly protein PilM [Candidatus Omnitrophota bacterium]MCF7878623.1 pilus assembly protein PilM [Candidatus Omnitrophota bacterium]MCF7892641.1 pilus assembly protein PilM [Candidatus Omnitrophota bacterium]